MRRREGLAQTSPRETGQEMRGVVKGVKGKVNIDMGVLLCSTVQQITMYC